MKTKELDKKKKNNKKNKKGRDKFETIFVSVSIIMFVLLVLTIGILKNSLYSAKDQVALNYLYDYKSGAINESLDPFIGISGNNKIENKENLKPLDNGLDPSLGSEEAKVKIFYFSDFSCPFCSEQEEILKKIYDNFSQDVRIIWKDYPDLESLESFSYQAARAARCANEQGAFWDYSKMLYDNKDSYNQEKSKFFLKLAESLKLNADLFLTCLTGNKVDQVILDNVLESENLGILGIPYIYINDTDMISDLSENDLEEIIINEIEKSK